MVYWKNHMLNNMSYTGVFIICVIGCSSDEDKTGQDHEEALEEKIEL